MTEDVQVVLHFPYESIKNVIETKLSAKCAAMVWYEHPPKRREVRHCHGYIKGLSVSRQTVKDWITTELGMKPDKKDWSFMNTIVKGDKKGQPVDIACISYFHKGEYPLKYKYNITDDVIKQYEALSYKPVEKENAKSSHTDKQLRKAGLSHWDVVEYVREKAHKTEVLRQTDIGLVYCSAYADYEQIYDLLVGKLEELKIKTHQSDLERWFCTIVRNDAGASAVVKQNILAKYKK